MFFFTWWLLLCLWVSVTFNFANFIFRIIFIFRMRFRRQFKWFLIDRCEYIKQSCFIKLQILAVVTSCRHTARETVHCTSNWLPIWKIHPISSSWSDNKFSTMVNVETNLPSPLKISPVIFIAFSIEGKTFPTDRGVKNTERTGTYLAPARFLLVLFFYPTCRREVRIVNVAYCNRVASAV